MIYDPDMNENLLAPPVQETPRSTKMTEERAPTGIAALLQHDILSQITVLLKNGKQYTGILVAVNYHGIRLALNNRAGVYIFASNEISTVATRISKEELRSRIGIKDYIDEKLIWHPTGNPMYLESIEDTEVFL